ncbi:urease subunit gamma [Paenibacillus soyae]|uniref:Urease subunit gamma n=1 Tax=Paenibacillus soyae TaxID=2969249 RepID=A0A9X2SAP7_9BACL|nr:urease subunit gamma [Paenibacillus soyae]MCR2804833.1 urease subunit gamma [Paenibacillus soyae]
MALTEAEKEQLLLMIKADLARRRLKRGVKLNVEECVALITSEIKDGAFVGKTVSELVEMGGKLLRKEQVMSGIAESLLEVKVEAAFPDGKRLVTVPYPIMFG